MGISAALGVNASGQPNKGDLANAVVSGKFSAVGPGRSFSFRGPINLAIWASVNTALTTTALSTAATIASATGLAAGDAINSVNVPPGTTMGALSGTNVTLAPPAVTLSGQVTANVAQISGLPSTAGLLGATVTVPSNAEGVTIPTNTTVIGIATAAVPPTNDSPGTPGVVQLSAAPTVAPNQSGPVPFDFAVTGNAILTTGADAAAIFTGAAVSYSATVQLEYSFDGGLTWLVANIGGSGALAQWTAGTPVRVAFGELEREALYRLNCAAYTSGTINYRISETGGAAESLSVGSLT